MAKDLPYFKFYCSEWTDGDITLENYIIQGLFINVCSYYWSNNCDVSLIKLKKKFKQESETIDYLIKEGLIKFKGDDIIISFLDEQLDERIETSKVKSKGGKASAEARRLKKLQQETNKDLTENEHVLNLCSTETQVLREDKIKEDKSKSLLSDRESKFLELFNELKTNSGLKSNIKVLSKTDKSNLKQLSGHPVKDFKHVINKMLESDWCKETGNQTPSHILRVENFNRYLDQNIINSKNESMDEILERINKEAKSKL